MKLLSRARSFLRNLLRKREVEQELQDELSSYVELLTENKKKAGMNEEEAKRATLLELGGVEQVKECVRESRRGYRLGLFLQDLRYAFRTLSKARTYTATVVLVLALGIGSTTLIFSIVDAVLLKGPPFPQADRLFTLWQSIPQEPRVAFSPKEFSALEKQTRVFESIAFATGNGFTISGRSDPELVIGRLVPPSFFRVLRTNALLGRTFLESEANEHVVVLSYAFWRDKLPNPTEALGQSVILNGEPYAVIGVLPKSFQFEGPDANLFVPASLANPLFAKHPDAHFLRVIARLKPGITPHQLDAEISRVGPNLDDGDESTARHYFAIDLKAFTTGELRAPLLVLQCAVAFLLLIACANVANLTLARSHARQAEFAVRAALGASRGRLISQLVTESTLLALVGGMIGIGVAMWGLDILRTLMGHNIPELLGSEVNVATLVLAFVASGLAVVFFGLGPALTASRTNLQEVVKGLSRSTTGVALGRYWCLRKYLSPLCSSSLAL